ncbi:acetylcholine receptor subunit alpha-L1-like [Haliotis rubra]|uniref:acetylcholine receptor subunit alpha-L1-like n=1 Tax=Haliotis rubra TaxID=36100 RepID=UPI001EE59944|nr:acetylcholine receptor subunit alpha-L1-like [Haliotis rubra]
MESEDVEISIHLMEHFHIDNPHQEEHWDFTAALFLALLIRTKLFSCQTLEQQLSLSLEIERRSVLASADPVAGQRIDVNMWFNLLFIIGLDERQQILTTSGWLDFWWNDDRYIWNSTEYGGIESVMVIHEKIWKPDIVVRNAVNSLGVVGTSDDLMRVFSSGYIEWSPANVYQTICEVDVRTFPFDSQVCFMNVSSWVYYADQVRLVPYGKGVILRHYKQNSEWELLSLDYEDAFYNFSDNHQNGVTFRFVLKRHSVFYILKILIPTVLLSMLNAFVFVVPVESGEKMAQMKPLDI